MFFLGGRDEDGARAGNHGKEGEEKMMGGGDDICGECAALLHPKTWPN